MTKDEPEIETHKMNKQTLSQAVERYKPRKIRAEILSLVTQLDGTFKLRGIYKLKDETGFPIDMSYELAKENDWAIDWLEAMAYAASQSVEKYKALVAEMNLLEPQTGFIQKMFACGFMATEGKDYNERAKNFYAKHYRD
jgi:alanyl-tRNA synthetase